MPLAAALKKPALLVHHDEDAEIYLNGQRVMALTGYRTDYAHFRWQMSTGRSLSRANLLAVFCKQEVGGQFIDVHLIEADQVPVLPTPEREVFAAT